MDVALQLRVAQVTALVNAANQLVELEDSLARPVMPGQGADIAHKDALAHLDWVASLPWNGWPLSVEYADIAENMSELIEIMNYHISKHQIKIESIANGETGYPTSL